MPTTKLFYSVTEACEVMRIGRSFLYQLLDQLLALGEIPSRTLGGRRLIPIAAAQPHYTVEEACAVVSIGRTLLYELVLKGEVPSKLLGRRRLIPVAALEQWAAGQGERHTDEPAGANAA